MPETIVPKAPDNTVAAEETKAAAAPKPVETKPMEKARPEPQAASLLEEQPEAMAEPKAETAAKPEEPVREGAPEKYEWKPPEGVTFDPDMLAKFEKAMRAADVPQAQANEVLGLGASWQLAYQNAEMAALRERADAWRKESEADPDIGGSKMRETAKAIRAYLQDENVLGPDGAKDLLAVLNETGLANHRGLLKALSIGARLNSEDVAAIGSGREKPEATIRSLYDKSIGLI